MNGKKFSIYLFLFFLLSILIIPSSLSHYGEGDCKDYHTGQSITLPYDPDANVELDGIPSENFWSSPKNKEGKTRINTSTINSTSKQPKIITVNFTFVRNAEYIFILCQWPDYTTRSTVGDAFYFCWNINVPNFSSYYPSNTMETNDMGGGYVDSWSWSVSDTEPENQSDYYCNDENFGEDGYKSPGDSRNIKVGYATRKNSHYTLEIRRKLTTGDPVNCDVQFDSTKSYEFNIGIINDSFHGEDHAISYTHSLNIHFKENLIDGFPLFPLFAGIGSISIAIIIYKKKILMRGTSNN